MPRVSLRAFCPTGRSCAELKYLFKHSLFLFRLNLIQGEVLRPPRRRHLNLLKDLLQPCRALLATEQVEAGGEVTGAGL